MRKTRISLFFFLFATINTAFPQAENITKQFNDAYRSFQSLNEEGKPGESLEFAKQALDLAQSLFDENSETMAALSYNYALNLMDVDQNKESAREFSKTVRIYEQVFGRNSESLASVYFDEGRASSRINRGKPAGRANSRVNSQKSKRAFEKAINIIGEIYGTSSLNFADINIQAGIILSEEFNLGTAENFFEKALNIYENEFGRDNLYTALANFHLGKYHFMNANVRKSENFLADAITGLESLEIKDDIDQVLLTSAHGLFDRLNEVKFVREEYVRELEENSRELARRMEAMRNNPTPARPPQPAATQAQ